MEVWVTSPQEVLATVINQQAAHTVVKADPSSDRRVPEYLNDLLQKSQVTTL